MASGTETEVKIRIVEPGEIQERLRGLGFQISAPRIFEANTLYDTPGNSLMRRGMLLRLRQAGDRAIVTWKGPGSDGPYKSRPELETAVASYDALAKILEQLGYNPTFRYEKYRTEYKREQQPGVVTVDETPIGNFLELEGEGDWIDETASQLGFSRADYVLSSYGRLYLADCERRGVQPHHMVFASQDQGAGSTKAPRALRNAAGDI